MRKNNLFLVTGKENRPALIQIGDLQPGDLLMLNRNLGAEGGLFGLTTVLTKATDPEQFDLYEGVPRYYRQVEVEPYLILPEPISHTDIANRIGKELIVMKTVNGIESPIDAQILDLFFERKFK